MIPKSTTLLEPKIKGMLFRTYTVNGIAYYVTNYEISDLTVQIVTDIKTFNILHVNLSRMLDIFIEAADSKLDISMHEAEVIPEESSAEETDVAVSVSQPAPASVPGETPRIEALSVSREIKDTLMDNIRRIQKDRTYVHQAAAINDTVKTLIEFAKTEIQAQELVIKMTAAVSPKTKQLL